jgi:small subunit ribosomal protein S24e
MKLVNKKEDKITKKTIYELEIEYKGQKTPDRKTVIEMASKELRIEKKLMIIKKINNVYGKTFSKITIHAYKDRQDLEKNEPKHLIKRVNFKEEEKPKKETVIAQPSSEEKPDTIVAPKKEEKPITKEEKKTEEKPVITQTKEEVKE